MSDCGSTALANDIMTQLRSDVGITIPEFDISGPAFQIPTDGSNPIFSDIARLNNDDLTTGSVTGNGTFDALMRGFNAHLTKEFENGRITGQEYTKAYIALTQGAMANATQYLLGRDQAYWAAVQAQQAARIAEIQVVLARIDIKAAALKLVTVQYEALNAESGYALTKLKLATESMNYCVGKYNLEYILPQELLLKVEQTRGAENQADQGVYQLSQLMPQQKLLMVEQTRQTFNAADHQALETTTLLPKQVAQVTAQTGLVMAQTTNQSMVTSTLLPQQVRLTQEQADYQEFQTDELGPQQLANMIAQVALTEEQVEVQRAQTLDTRTDGVTVVGVVGKQKALHSQQIISYQRDAEIKAARIFTDAWITQKTIDEGLLPPNGFTNTTLDQILATIKTANSL